MVITHLHGAIKGMYYINSSSQSLLPLNYRSCFKSQESSPASRSSRFINDSEHTLRSSTAAKSDQNRGRTRSADSYSLENFTDCNKMAPVASRMCCLPDGYGFVVFSAIGNHFVNIWMAMNVGKARKQYKIEYPTMYDPENKTFNCIQRAHQQTLEVYPNFLYLLFIGGLQYPKIVAGAGILYSLSRIAFAKGYYTGDPKNRRWGAFGHIAELILLGSAISWACHQLKWVGTGAKCC